MCDVERVVILREVTEIERKIAIEEAQIEGAKLQLAAAKTAGKERITALTDEAGMSATAFANKVPWSQAFMRELMRHCHPLQISFVPGQSDQTMMREGERNIGNWLLLEIKRACPEMLGPVLFDGETT